MLRTQQARATGLAGDFEAARILEEVELAGPDGSRTPGPGSPSSAAGC